MDGKEFEVDSPRLIVPIKDGEWYSPPDQVVKEFQVYVRKGNIYEKTNDRVSDPAGDGCSGNRANNIDEQH